MLRSNLAARLMAHHQVLNRLEAERVVNAVLAAITMALATGMRVELRGFGAFAVKIMPQRMGRNPRTGETVSVQAKRRLYFRTGADLKKRLNSNTDSPAEATTGTGQIRPGTKITSGSAEVGG